MTELEQAREEKEPCKECGGKGYLEDCTYLNANVCPDCPVCKGKGYKEVTIKK
uniref:Uncharacterized protein n=1 Tax=viral metagenome TaxID=1070528 RepID=A0A6M3Y3D6_9ZZZZ